MGVRRALALFGDAMGEGKGGPVEAGLTGPLATALVTVQLEATNNIRIKRRLVQWQI